MSSMSAAALRPYRTDLEPNSFSSLRAALGIVYPEPTGACSTLFWPGCALASSAPALTTSVYEWLRERGLADGITTRCCGNILRFSASCTEHQEYLTTLRQYCAELAVERVITACPNCFYALRESIGSQIEVLVLIEVLAQYGLRLTPELLGARTVAIHDSCPDRRGGIIAASLRTLCEGLEIRELAHNRTRSLCCGMGKLLFLSAPDTSESLHRGRLAEFYATCAEVLLCSCMSCTQALQPDPPKEIVDNPALLNGKVALPAQGVAPAATRTLHYLEPLFGHYVDWSALRGM